MGFGMAHQPADTLTVESEALLAVRPAAGPSAEMLELLSAPRYGQQLHLLLHTCEEKARPAGTCAIRQRACSAATLFSA